MAVRPVFLPNYKGEHLVEEMSLDFPWSSGFAEIQKKKNVRALHAAASSRGIESVLEISSKSDEEVGKRLSAFSLKIDLENGTYPLESVYQGSKVFDSGGPHPELFEFAPRDAKKFIRRLDAGRLIGFYLEGENYPLSPKNAFYDWLYIRALARHSDWISKNVVFQAFSDIEFNPARQVNCQARAFAEYLSLLRRGLLPVASNNFSEFASLLKSV